MARLETISRIGLYISGVMWVGLPLVWRIIAPNPLLSSKPMHLITWVRFASLVFALASTVLFVTQMLGVGLENLTTTLVQWFVFESELGWAWGGRVFLAGLTWVVLPKIPVKHWWWVAVLIGFFAQISISLNGHTAAHFPGPNVMIALGHLLGSSIWAGGLVLLSTHLLPWHKSAELRRASLQTVCDVMRRFAPVGICGVGLLTASGLNLVALHLPDLSNLTQTQYGKTLIIKVFLAIGAMVLGAVHWLIVPQLLRTVRQFNLFMLSIQIETVIVLGVLVFAGRLTSLSPGHDAHNVMTSNLSTYLQVFSGLIIIVSIGALTWQWDRTESKK